MRFTVALVNLGPTPCQVVTLCAIVLWVGGVLWPFVVFTQGAITALSVSLPKVAA